MKPIFFAITLLLFAFYTKGQTSIMVILKTKSKIDSVSMMDVSQKEHHILPYQDTLTFNFDKKNLDCYTIRYELNGGICWQQLWLNAQNVIVKAHSDDKLHLIIDTVINSPIYYAVINYNKTIRKLNKDTIALNDFMLREIQKNIETPWSLAIATGYVGFNQNSRIDLVKLKQVLSKQQTDFSWSIYYAMGIKKMNKLLEIKNVNLADFSFIDKENKSVAISLNNFDYYLLDFWFVGCLPCERDHIEIKSHQLQLKNKGIKVIGIETVGAIELWKKYLMQHGYTWDNYRQPKGNKLTDYLSLSGFPAYVMLNGKGDIVRTYSSIDEVFSKFNIK